MSEMSMQLLVRLGSLVVHVQEMDTSNPSAFEFDLTAAKQLADDPLVAEWLQSIDPALLPSKRSDA